MPIILKIFFISLFCVMPVLTQGQALSDKSEKLRELEKLKLEIEQSNLDTTKIESAVKTYSDDHAKLIAAAVDAGNSARVLETKLSQSELRQLMLETNETGIRNSLMMRQDQIGDILSALQRMGVRPTPALLNSPEDTMVAIRSSLLLASVIPEMKREAESLANELKELIDVRQKSIAERELWKKDMASLHLERQKLEAIAEARQLTLRTAEGSLNEAKARGLKLSKEAITIEQFLQSLEPSPQKPVSVPNGRLTPQKSFKELTGKLRWPVNGRITRAFGANDEIGVAAKGVTLTTQAKAIITAPSDATVVYAGPFRSYKQFLILNAGDGYHIIIAGMEKISVETGQYVVSGEPVAMMGTTSSLQAFNADKQSAPALYMEFRKDNVPVNPAGWMIAQTN